MATKAKTGTKKDTKGKVKAKATARPGDEAPAVDPFAAPPAGAKKKAPAGDNVHVAPADDAELGNIAADIATYAKAKAAKKSAEAALEAAAGAVMGYAKRVLLGLISEKGSKPKGQKLAGDDDAVITTYYQDRAIKVDEEAYAILCSMLGKEVVDTDIVESSKTFTLNPAKVADPELFAKIRTVLQSKGWRFCPSCGCNIADGAEHEDECEVDEMRLTAADLTELFIPSGRTSRKGVVEMASKLCDGDTGRIDQLLQLTVPKPTLK